MEKYSDAWGRAEMRNVFDAVRGWRAGLVIGLLLLQLLNAAAAQAKEILVFAAASLKNALDEADAAYRQKSGVKVSVSYAASGALARQIENGAPADVFISADEEWMNRLQKEGLIRPGTRADWLGNRLVLVASANSGAKLDLKPGLDLMGALKGGRLAIGDPKFVPAGRYAQAALQKLGAWDALRNSLALSDSVRAALALVSRGEAPLGIVYETDVAADKGVRIIGVFPEDSHPPIVYPIALTAGSKNPDAPKYLAWLKSREAAPFFEKQGFRILP